MTVSAYAPSKSVLFSAKLRPSDILISLIAMEELLFGKEHPNVSRNLNNLAQLLQATNRLSEAETLMRRGLAIEEQSRGLDHPLVAIQLSNLALLLLETKRYPEAESLMRRAIKIDEACPGNDNQGIATRLHIMATLLYSTNQMAEAEEVMRRALGILVTVTLATGHPNLELQTALRTSFVKTKFLSQILILYIYLYVPLPILPEKGFFPLVSRPLDRSVRALVEFHYRIDHHRRFRPSLLDRLGVPLE